MAKTQHTPQSSTLADLKNYLDGLKLPATPVVHVNGKDHPTALLVVDFGAPLVSVRLSSEQNQELTSHIRRAAKDLLRSRDSREVSIRVSSDNYAGLVYWGSISFQ